MKITQIDPQKQRKFARRVIGQLQDAGYEALWAGGCVRDDILGQVPKDYDIATSARPDNVRQLFGHRRTLAVGAAFGVIVVLGPREAGQIDVATFREDATYSDGRRPDHVTFSTAELDASRRDFTINGLFFDPIKQEIIDYVGGQQDIQDRVVRAIGDPMARLAEDKLRMLRAVRFTATFDFEMDEATLAAVQAMADDILTISGERIGQEVRRMLAHASRATALEWLRRSKLLRVVLPEVAVLDEKWQSMLQVSSALHDPSLPLALAALLCQSTTTDTATDVVRPIRDRLRLSNSETARLDWLLARREDVARARDLPWPQLQRLLIRDGIEELLALHEAITSTDDPHLVYCREKLALPAEQLNPPPLITGDDLLSHGVPPGQHFQALLDGVRDSQLNGEITNRDEAIALIDRFIDNGDGSGGPARRHPGC